MDQYELLAMILRQVDGWDIEQMEVHRDVFETFSEGPFRNYTPDDRMTLTIGLRKRKPEREE